MDYAATLYDPIYSALGVDATLTLRGGASYSGLTALDKSAGVDVGDGGAQVGTLTPAAALRVPELTALGLTVAQLPLGSITFNGFTWHVTSTKPRPSPRGELDGEVWLILGARTEAESESES